MSDEQRTFVDGWQVVEPNVWKPAGNGDFIEGVLINVNRRAPNVDGDISSRYWIDVKEQGTMMAWGSTVLDDRMQFVKVGTLVRITFCSEEKTKRGRTVKIYKVEVHK